IASERQSFLFAEPKTLRGAGGDSLGISRHEPERRHNSARPARRFGHWLVNRCPKMAAFSHGQCPE
ncbi:MAG: hypothetical protein ACM3II_14295, partial [Rhodospirillaceae bacterium]